MYPLHRARVKLQKLVASYHIAAARAVCQDNAMPLTYWLNVRWALGLLADSTSCLTPARGMCSDQVKVAELSNIFSNVKLDSWALHPTTLRFLWKSLTDLQPRNILEFGSGLSTLMLAQYALTQSEGRTRIVSIEQDYNAYSRTKRLLRELGLEEFVTLIAAPLGSEGQYQISPTDVAATFQGNRPAWVLIDGPHGPPGCRAHTLLRFGGLLAPRCAWFLDDAYRDGELHCLERWEKTNWIHVRGIIPIGRGLGTGIITEQTTCGR